MPNLRLTLFQRLWAIAGAVSIRVKVLGIVLGVILLLGILVTLQVREILTETLELQLEHQGANISENIIEHVIPMLASGNREATSSYLLEMQTHYSNESHNTAVNYILVTDRDRNILAHTFPEQIPDNLPLAELASNQQHAHAIRDDADVLEIATQQGAIILHLGLSEDSNQDAVNGMVRRIVYITLLMIAIGLAAAVFLTWIVTRPILSLVEATGAVAKGDFSRRVPRWANDEIGDLAEAFNSMIAALEIAEQERQQQAARRDQYVSGVILAQEEERKRIARELHDSTSQSLTSLLVALRALENIHDPEQAKTHLADMRQVVSSTLEEVHLMSRQLRPSVLDDLGMTVALQRYISETQSRTGIHIDLVILGIEDRLPAELETTVYRIVQEAVTNIVRHASAATASVLVEKREQTIRIIVEDNGIGFNPEMLKLPQQRLGLQGIQERATLFGGKMTIETASDQGTTVFVELPAQR